MILAAEGARHRGVPPVLAGTVFRTAHGDAAVEPRCALGITLVRPAVGLRDACLNAASFHAHPGLAGGIVDALHRDAGPRVAAQPSRAMRVRKALDALLGQAARAPPKAERRAAVMRAKKGPIDRDPIRRTSALLAMLTGAKGFRAADGAVGAITGVGAGRDAVPADALQSPAITEALGIHLALKLRKDAVSTVGAHAVPAVRLAVRVAVALDAVAREAALARNGP